MFIQFPFHKFGHIWGSLTPHLCRVHLRHSLQPRNPLTGLAGCSSPKTQSIPIDVVFQRFWANKKIPRYTMFARVSDKGLTSNISCQLLSQSFFRGIDPPRIQTIPGRACSMVGPRFPPTIFAAFSSSVPQHFTSFYHIDLAIWYKMILKYITMNHR
jgi:hypothetical protein